MTDFQTEKEFANDTFSYRARSFCISSVTNLKSELIAKGLNHSRSGLIRLFTDDSLTQSLAWLNETIGSKFPSKQCFKLSDMHMFLAFHLFSHCTGLSLPKCYDLMGLHTDRGEALEKIRFIGSKIPAYSPFY